MFLVEQVFEVAFITTMNFQSAQLIHITTKNIVYIICSNSQTVGDRPESGVQKPLHEAD